MKKQNYKGFTLVEVLLTMALAITFSIGTIGLFRIAALAGARSTRQLQAKLLAKEGIEAVIAIRDKGGSNWDWSITPENTSSGEYYQPTIIGNEWVLGSKSTVFPPPLLPSPYTAFSRTVEINEVQRAVGCGSSICPIVTDGGVIDSGTRKIIVTVRWKEENEDKTININSYVTRWR